MRQFQPASNPRTERSASIPPAIRWLGRTGYAEAVEWQNRIKAHILDGGAGEIGILEHPALLTIGKNEERDQILPSETAGLPLVRTDRGGKMTYHGPGQAVVYPVIDLRPYRLRARAWVRLLETIGLETLTELGAPVGRRPGCPGVWAGRKKIMAIGCNLRDGVNTHGISINVSVDLSIYQRFDPCGTTALGLGVTDLATEIEGQPVPSVETVGTRYAQRLADRLAELGGSGQ